MCAAEVESIGDPAGRPATPARHREFLIASHKTTCRECWGCIRYCPARAIRVVHGVSEIIEDRCVKCGLCVSECGNSGHVVRDDTEAVRDLLASDRPVVVVLATEFVAALHPLSPSEVERSLESVGFYAVESTLLGEETVAVEYERQHARGFGSLTIRSTCPVVVDWVRKFYPSLVPALSPIVPPYVAQARLVKTIYPAGTAVVYVSPCYARKDEAYDPQFAGVIDAAIDFTELERLMGETRPRLPHAARAGSHRPAPVKEISLTDGFPRKTIAERSGVDTSVAKIRGLRALDELLRAVTLGEAGPAVIDALNCEGCIDGPAVRPGLSVFAKRNIVAAESAASVRPHVSTRDLLGYLPSVEAIRSFRASPVLTLTPSADEIDHSLAEGGFSSREEALDCGACGYPTCVEHASAVIRSDSSWDMCFPLQRRRMRAATEQMERDATIDALTGLGNRRTFDERLAEEISRRARYGAPLSLLMIDVDAFKSINDTHGHVAGDEVLRRVAEVLRGELRETDMAHRYGGDEFAVLLPGTGKTAAFAVAEKLRQAVESSGIDVGTGGRLSVTLSVGVASASDGLEPVALLESADRALYQAKRSGRNQVRIAAG